MSPGNVSSPYLVHIMIAAKQLYLLDNQYKGIPNYIYGLPGDRLDFHDPAKWSIRDQVAHLAKYQPEFLRRIKLIVDTDVPSFPRYRADEDPEFEMWRSWTITKLIEALERGRHEIILYLNSLTPTELNRQGIHPIYGKLNIVDWVEFFLLHESHHLFSIFQLAHRSGLD